MLVMSWDPEQIKSCWVGVVVCLLLKIIIWVFFTLGYVLTSNTFCNRSFVITWEWETAGHLVGGAYVPHCSSTPVFYVFAACHRHRVHTHQTNIIFLCSYDFNWYPYLSLSSTCSTSGNTIPLLQLKSTTIFTQQPSGLVFTGRRVVTSLTYGHGIWLCTGKNIGIINSSRYMLAQASVSHTVFTCNVNRRKCWMNMLCDRISYLIC